MTSADLGPYVLPGVGALLLLLTVPLGVVRGLAALQGRFARRTRIRRLMRGHARDAGDLTPLERLDALWFRLHLAGSPFEWLAGAVALTLLLAVLAQVFFGTWVVDLGMPLDGLFLLAYLVTQSHAVTLNRHMTQMSTAFHIVATEFNVAHNVSTALLQAYPRIPSPVNQRFASSLRLLTSGSAPIHVLERLGSELGPPYGKVFASILEQGLASSSVDKLLAQVATMTEEWQAARKQTKGAVAGQKLTGLMFNVGFYPVVAVARHVFPQVAAYQNLHPLVVAPGIAAIAAGFVVSMLT